MIEKLKIPYKEIKMIYTNAKDAKAAKAKKFFTGKECKKGHVAFRFTCNSECVECDSIRKEKRKNKVAKVKTIRVVTFMPVSRYGFGRYNSHITTDKRISVSM